MNYNIYHSQQHDFAEAVRELLRQVPSEHTPLRYVFFGHPDSNVQYMAQRSAIIGILEQWYGYARMPLVSYVSQPPLGAELVLEAQSVDVTFTDSLVFKELEGHRYVVATPAGQHLMLTEGLLATNIDAPIMVQSQQVFAVLGRILSAEGFDIDSIDRQWNYIERITHISNDKQNYQEFNDARSAFYSAAQWERGYPAATGIGTSFGGIMVEVDASQVCNNVRVVTLDNSMQVAAHEYSKDVLLGEQTLKSTPKFERAKAVVYSSALGDKQAKIYISGTAAIRGEDSMTDVNIEGQTVATLENIEYLVGMENLRNHGVILKKGGKIQIFRVYLKLEKDYEQARNIVATRYPTVSALYVLTDVCRDELLIEIEGIAQA